MNSFSRRARLASSSILAAFLILFATHNSRAATVPAGFTDTVVAGNLTNATAMAIAPDGRIFVCLQDGSLRVVKNGALLPTPFVTVTVSATGERGLLGVAFDPNFATNNFVYIYYTATTPAIHNRVSRFTANGDVAVANSETVLLDLDNLSAATNHNGGAMHFGPDGKLYIAVGENANAANSQTLANLLGKMLRINSDGTIPADNPFFSTATGKNRAIWALGLRNPYTFNFQPTTGRMFINDVGQNAFEEVNDGIAASNYGWPICEGQSCSSTPPANYRAPLFVYGHTGASPTGCAITGGTFYNPTTQQFPAEYVGKYFFADFCTSFIGFIDPASPAVSSVFANGASSPVDLQVSNDGSLYYLQRGSTGQLRRIQYPAGQVPPSIGQHPQSQTVAAGQPVTFTVSATGATPLQFQWQRNNADIPNANSDSYTIPAVSAADNGAQFRCIVTNAFGSAPSNNATLTVTTTTPSASAHDVLISEYRLDGPGGLLDEFVELYNNTDADITVSTADNSAGWALVTGREGASGVTLDVYHVIPSGKVIPARGHYLITGNAYTLGNYGGANRALGDAVVAQNDLSGDDAQHPFRGVALFRTADAAGFTSANRLDAVGGACADARLSEGTPHAGFCQNVGTAATPAANYSLVRRQPAGTPQDTDNNAADFALVAVQSPLQSAATGSNIASELGAPGPENTTSPVQHNATIKASLVDPQVASSAAPNRVRAGGQIPNGQFGTFTIRRRFTNKTGRTVTALRFRLTGITTLGTPVTSAPQADLRATTSSDTDVQTSSGLITVKGTILEQPATQASGGGLNSTLVVPLAGGALIANASVDVQFVLGVQQDGSFRFFVNVEALTQQQPAALSRRKGAAGKSSR
ncbi:MAG TPA: PQQ-dependent sugar dehydrogenase [Pyrinomonadaceae bacterium]|nr:PQQ-dependent sugar dehydrogenase [Pyrinomonadaceae bacterium]